MRIPLTSLLFLLCGLTATAQLQLMPLADIRPGMKGTGRTVFTGGTVEEFQAEVLGILENAGPKQSIILARLSGGPLEKTGVLQGMSGSPVYIDGKHTTTLRGTYDELAVAFKDLVDNYVATRYARK